MEKLFCQKLYVGIKYTPCDLFNIDLMAALLNQDNKIEEKGDYVFFNSDTRTQPFDPIRHRNRHAWRESTNAMSIDESVILHENFIDDNQDLFALSDSDLLQIDLSKISNHITRIDLCLSIYDERYCLNDIEMLEIYFYRCPSNDNIFSHRTVLSHSNSKFIVLGSLCRSSIGEWEWVEDNYTYLSVIEYLKTIS